jgi:hypothetical protein
VIGYFPGQPFHAALIDAPVEVVPPGRSSMFLAAQKSKQKVPSLYPHRKVGRLPQLTISILANCETDFTNIHQILDIETKNKQ